MTTKLPRDVDGLISYLDKQYPNQSAQLQWTDREVWFKAGQRQVVEHLLMRFNEQADNIMDTD